MKPLEFHAPASLDEAISLLTSNGASAAPLAGGTDLIIQHRSGRKELEHMVDLKRIPELQVLEYDAQSGLRLGAAVACADLASSEALVANYPSLLEGAELIGSMQIQFRASVGGNICNGSPAADTICPLIVLGASCVILGKGGRREVSAAEFMTGPGQTALQPGEILVEIKIPPPAKQSSSAYLRFIPRNEMDIAVASAAVSVTLDADGETCTAASVAIGAVGPTPIVVGAAGDALVGTKLDAAALEAAGKASSAAAKPIDDIRGTAEYRVHMSGVLTRRAIEIALTCAKENR